jgi:hypothetical protein
MPQGEVKIKSVGARPGDFKSGNNAAAIIPIGGTGARKEMCMVCWSYNAVPTGGRLTIMGGGFNFDVDITSGGPGFIPFNPPVHATDNANIVVTLYAGGVGVIGKLNLLRGSD